MTTTLTDDEKAQQITENSFVLNLTIGSIKRNARVRGEKVEKVAGALIEEEREREKRAPETAEEMVEAAADGADEIRISKDLLKVAEVQQIVQQIIATRALIRRTAQPKAFLKGGMHLFSAARIEWVESEIKRASEAIAALLDSLEARWDAIIEEERARLTPLGLFDPRDYPTLASIREAVMPRYCWLQFDVPTRLRKLNPALFEAERAKARSAWAAYFDAIRLTYRETLQQFVATLADVLKPGEDGRRRTLRQASLDKMTDFLRTYRLQDITGDEELAALTDKALAVLNGVDAEVLRTEKRAAERVRAEMDSLREIIEPLVTEQQRRVVLK
jgi:hypothetical protein